MPFTEVCIYQVHPQKVDAFEAVLREAKPFLEQQQGLLQLRLIKRGYRIDLEEIKEGLPPPALTRIVKSVKYMLYWEFDTKESYGAAQKNHRALPHCPARQIFGGGALLAASSPSSVLFSPRPAHAWWGFTLF